MCSSLVWANAIIKGLIGFYVDKLNLTGTCLIDPESLQLWIWKQAGIRLQAEKGVWVYSEEMVSLHFWQGERRDLINPELIKLSPVGK